MGRMNTPRNGCETAKQVGLDAIHNAELLDHAARCATCWSVFVAAVEADIDQSASTGEPTIHLKPAGEFLRAQRIAAHSKEQELTGRQPPPREPLAIPVPLGCQPVLAESPTLAMQPTTWVQSTTRTSGALAPEVLFLEHLSAIDRIISFVCRRNRVEPAEAEEFASEVKLCLIERNYEIIRKFEGRCSFSTYLTTVIQRLFYQYRVKLWGKWRPSAEARRMGDLAVALERLVCRDGFTVSEALEALTKDGVSCKRAELESICLRLPLRQRRPVLVIDAQVSAALSVDSNESNPRQRRQKEARLMANTLEEAMSRLSADDQRLLQLRFWNGLRVPEVAVALQLDQKKTYKRVEKLLAKLRRELEEQGVTREMIEDVLLRQNDIVGILEPLASSAASGMATKSE